MGLMSSSDELEAIKMDESYNPFDDSEARKLLHSLN